MYGSNYNGQAYYGQGPAVGTSFILATVSASVTTTATIAFQVLVLHTLTATVTTTAFIARYFMKVLAATSLTSSAVFTGLIILALNLRRASSRPLTLENTTKTLNLVRQTFNLNLTKTTRDTIED